MNKQKQPVIITATQYLTRFFDACIKCDIAESSVEETNRYKRPYNYFRNIVNNDGA